MLLSRALTPEPSNLVSVSVQVLNVREKRTDPRTGAGHRLKERLSVLQGSPWKSPTISSTVAYDDEWPGGCTWTRKTLPVSRERELPGSGVHWSVE